MDSEEPNIFKTDARVQAAAERRASMEEMKAAELGAEMEDWAQKQSRAEVLHSLCVEEKRARAQVSLDDVSAGHARAEVAHAIRDSTVALDMQAHDLKAALAMDKKASQVELIKEKQPHLQGITKKVASAETVFDDVQ